MHTYTAEDAIIIAVKTPQYIIWFLLHPIVKIPSPKKAVTSVLSFLLCVRSAFVHKDSQIHLKSVAQMGFAHT